jgi:nucleotide-binding universal stress UspA family protein
MKKILVPVDFTSYSENAIKMAGYFAGVKGMEVKLLYILEEPSKSRLQIPFINYGKEQPVDYMPELEQTAREHLDKFADMYLANVPRFSSEVRISKTGISSEILREECDVIIMGRRRPENREPVWSGAIAEKIVRLSAAPVITVGELPENYSINNIAFASDFNEEEVKPILLRILDLAQIFNADLHLVYVQLNRNYLDPATTRHKLQEIMGKLDLQNFDLNIYVSDSAEEGITRYTDEYHPDLLVMCTHGRTGISAFFNGSISESVSAYGSVPVLTYNISKKNFNRSTQPIARTIIRERSRKEPKNNL